MNKGNIMSYRYNFTLFDTLGAATEYAVREYLNSWLDEAMTQTDEELCTEILTNWGLPEDADADDALRAIARIREKYEYDTADRTADYRAWRRMVNQMRRAYHFGRAAEGNRLADRIRELESTLSQAAREAWNARHEMTQR